MLIAIIKSLIMFQKCKITIIKRMVSTDLDYEYGTEPRFYLYAIKQLTSRNFLFQILLKCLMVGVLNLGDNVS